jgi:hypothetical protein
VALLDRAPDVPKNLRTTLAVAAKTALLEAPEEAAAQLSALPPDEARQLLLEATTPMQAASNAHYAAVEAQEADESAAGVLEPAPHEALATAYDLLIAQAQGTGDEHAASVLGVELVRVMLALDHMELRAAASHRLADHAPIEDADLIGKVLAATARRTVGKWPLWLDPLSAATIGTDDSLSEQAGSLAATLWTKLTGDEAPSDSDAELAISALARCATDASSHTELQAAVHEALDAPLMTSAVIASQEATLQHACQMASAGLLDRSALADMVLGGVAQTLEEATLAVQSYSATPTSIRVAEQPVVVAAVLARVREEAPYATAPTIQRVLKAAPVAATWLSAAELGNVQVASAAALRTRDPDASCPVTLDALHDLAATAGAEETVDDTLALWLEHFSETPEDAWHLVEPLVDNELPPKTSAALSSFAQQVDGSGRFVLIEQALQRTIAKPVHRSFFAAARLSEVPAPKAAERLGQLFDVAGDDTGWRGVLDVWQQLSPTGEAAQRRLVDEVYLPLIRSGDVGLDLAISFFGLVANVKGVRKRVTEALKLAAKTDGQKRSVDERLLSAKWKRRSLFGFGPAVDADEQP